MFKRFIQNINYFIKISCEIRTLVRLILEMLLFSTYIRLPLFRKWINLTQSYSYSIKGKPSIPINFRKQDLPIFFEVFRNKCYEFKEITSSTQLVIVDLGAHIGFTANYFFSKYDVKKYVAIEPSFGNFTLLELNTTFSNKIELINKAIYYKSTNIYLNETAIFAHNFQINDHIGKKTDTIDMYNLIRENQIDHIDILKIDIEGAEKDLFSQEIGWLRLVKYIIIELHEEYNEETLKKVLNTYNFELVAKNKNILCFKSLNYI